MKIALHRTIDGRTQKVSPFKYVPKRNIGDQIMNINNDVVTILLACKNDITIGDRVYLFYVTLYQSKCDRGEESAPYHKICLA